MPPAPSGAPSRRSGCYGHNGADDVALDAALLAREVPGRPVSIQWSRDDEFDWEPYGSAMLIKTRAALDARGNIVDWQLELWSTSHGTRPGGAVPGGPLNGSNLLAAWYLAQPQYMGPAQGFPQPAGGGERNSIPLYDFPSQRIVHHFIPDMPIAGLCAAHPRRLCQRIRGEVVMDELAAVAGTDPLAFRLAHMKDPRARAVIEAVAKKAGWKEGEKGDGTRGRGIAFARYRNLACYVRRGRRRSRLTAQTVPYDARAPGQRSMPGLIINPDGLDQPDRGRHRAVGELDAA